MGSRNLDRIPITDRRRHGETVGQMRVNGWKIQAQCRTCRLAFNLALLPYIALRGPMFSLWGATIKCPNAACYGRAVICARAPGMARFEELTVEREPRPAELPAWRRAMGPDPPRK